MKGNILLFIVAILSRSLLNGDHHTKKAHQKSPLDLMKREIKQQTTIKAVLGTVTIGAGIVTTLFASTIVVLKSIIFIPSIVFSAGIFIAVPVLFLVSGIAAIIGGSVYLTNTFRDASDKMAKITIDHRNTQ